MERRQRAVEMLVSEFDAWRGRRVFVTGHTGFKGSWLTLWLHRLGAVVTGYALPPPTEPSLFALAGIADLIDHIEGDVRDLPALSAAIERAKPEVVFHLAAQPLVRLSYAEPVETYATNVMGTVNLLEACRGIDGIAAIVCVTSDKCYENREWVWPYRESDAMGGFDPYSSSKGAAELVIAAYRRSFFHDRTVASVRAGNVIGGADWAADRLIPDIVRAGQRGVRTEIRAPRSVRPWQHVLEALGGYLLIAGRLLAGDDSAATGWNFGPEDRDARPVGWIADYLTAQTGGGWDHPGGEHPHEAKLLRLDCSKARAELSWRPSLTLEGALDMVIDWHRRADAGEAARAITLDQIDRYRTLAFG